MEKFSSTHEEIQTTDFHTWGCPVYVLDAENQSGSIGTPKWDPKSHAGIYLGHSPCHAGNVSLILNLSSGLISPQFHVVFDDEFTTVDYLESDITPPNWIALSKHAVEHSTPQQEELAYSWLHPDRLSATNSIDDTPNKIEKIGEENSPSTSSKSSPSPQRKEQRHQNTKVKH